MLAFCSQIFRKICPLSVRKTIVYPSLECFRSALANLKARCEPLALIISSIRMDFFYRSDIPAKQAVGNLTEEWKERIRVVCESPDNAHIPRHANAGKLSGSTITMHNGLKVRALGYYGGGILNMLIQNKGVHEPQEERAFATILPYIRSGGVILELGAYWGFYSMWFAKNVRNATCYLVEPDPRNIVSGKQNFKLNGLAANFTRSAIGTTSNTGLKSGKATTVDRFCETHRISRLDILHADIQGAEALMLQGAINMFSKKAIDYVFISTHGSPRHEACLQFLRDHNYLILCSATDSESYSLDGLIVARNAEISGPDHLEISHRGVAL